MKATFALLAPYPVFNLVRTIAWDAHTQQGINLDVARIAPHVSLKQPFAVRNLTGLTTYMAELAASITPFDIRPTELQANPAQLNGVESAILWLDVAESTPLRGLHNRVNAELTARFGASPAQHDGANYHFHMTIAIGSQPFEAYRNFLSEYGQPTLFTFQPDRLAMFIYDDDFQLNRGYMTDRVLPLGAD